MATAMRGKSATAAAAILLLLLCACLPFAVAVAGQLNYPDCGSAQACFPWQTDGAVSQNPCRRGSRFNLRFMVDVAAENTQRSGDTNFTTAIYPFCPKVDTLQSFSLRGAPFLAGGYKVKVNKTESFHLTQSLTLSYLSVFGFGNTNNTLLPLKGLSTGSVVFAQNGSIICGMYRSLAVVTTLMLEVGLNDGVFNYVGATTGGMQLIANPNYDNETCWQITHNTTTSTKIQTSAPAAAVHRRRGALTLEKSAKEAPSSSSSHAIDYCSEQIEVYVPPNIAQPLKTGFVPTCAVDKVGDDYCLFGDDQLCVGNPGQKNCARCYTSVDGEKLAKQANVQVWMSYYGTDSKRRTLTSGGANPMCFRKFAKPNMLNIIGAKINSLWNKTTGFIERL